MSTDAFDLGPKRPIADNRQAKAQFFVAAATASNIPLFRIEPADKKEVAVVFSGYPGLGKGPSRGCEW